MRIYRKIYLLFLPLIFSLDLSSNEVEPPIFSDKMQAWCLENPYDCESDQIITPHLLNTFMYQYYLEVENYFLELGFDKAEFEYCNSVRCLEEGVDVKNAPYKITSVFPKKGNYFVAFGGVNRNQGVYFLKDLSAEESEVLCSMKVRSGNKLSKRAARAVEQQSVESLGEFQSKFYKKYVLQFAQYLPSIIGLESFQTLPSGECWLTNKREKLIFEITEERQ